MRTEKEPAPTLELLDERACVFQKTAVFMRQAYPNGAVMTYDNTRNRPSEHIMLAKFVIGIGDDEPVWLTYRECTDKTTADNVPGGLVSRVQTINGDEFQAAWYPLIYGESDSTWEGAAVLYIHSEERKTFWLRFGCGNITSMHFSPNKDMAGENIDCEEGSAAIENGCVVIKRNSRRITTVVKGVFDEVKIKSISSENLIQSSEVIPHTYAEAKRAGNDIYVVVAFSEDRESAMRLAQSDPVEEEKRVHEYYSELLKNWQLNTPDEALNEAFGHAMLNLEYSWLYPYGWIESFHHWPVICHIEHTAAEEWNGRYERTLTCLRTEMKNVFPNGAIPDISADGSARRDWGGSNQFFFRDVEHYIKMTGDIEFAKEAEPYLEKALIQTFSEYDPTGSGILGWATQIGNQEDFESTPGKGAATGAEGVRMLEIMAFIKRLLGKDSEAEAYTASAEYYRKKWYDMLWRRDIGRPIWFEDIHGEKRLETTYHGIIYPILYDYLCDTDKISAIEHIKSRLTGPEGEIYQTNHFGYHAYEGVPTWGMQCGSDMQPFASAAYASLGMKNEAVKPLSFIAKRVCGEYQRGSWPETANEKRFAYFSPSAALYSQAIIETIFGLKRDMTVNTTTITPSIPDNWPHASLRIPGINVCYTTVDNGFRLQACFNDRTRKIIRVLCPPSEYVLFRTADYTKKVRAAQHCGWSSAELDMGEIENVDIECIWEPINIECTYNKTAVCGGKWNVNVGGDVVLTGVYDSLGVLDDIEIEAGKLRARLRSDLLKEYDCYGWFGRINFARRSIFLKLRSKDTELMYPCSVTAVVPLFCRAHYMQHDNSNGEIVNGEIVLEIWNQTCDDIQGAWHILYGEKCFTSFGEARRKTKSSIVFEIKNGAESGGAGFSCFSLFSPGINKAVLSGPSELAKCSINIYAGCSVYSACSGCPAYSGYSGCAACAGHSEYFVCAGTNSNQIEKYDLPREMLMPFENWREIGLRRSHGHMILNPDAFLKNIFEEYGEMNLFKDIPVQLDSKGFIPFSKEKYPLVTLPLNGKRMKKIYLLCSAFVDNHDVFSKILHIEAEAVQKDAYIRPVYKFDFYYPGQLDMGFGKNVIAGFTTYENGTDRSRVPEFPVESGAEDYKDAKPPVYPEKYMWSESRAVECGDVIFNLLELDLGDFREMKELRITACQSDSAGGIFAAAVHSCL